MLDGGSPQLSAREQDMVAPTDDGIGSSADKLRVLFVTEDDPLYVIRFFDVFFSECPSDEFDICGVTIDRAFHESIWRTLRRMNNFYGPLGVFRLGLRFVAARLRGRSIKSLVHLQGAPLVPTATVNCPEYIERIRAMAPDVIVSVAAPELFKRALLALPRLGCINIHCGRLPTYRGMMPTFWQMLRGESAVTITVHTMAEKLDAGAVIATGTLELKARDSLDRVITEAKRTSARLLIRVLRDLKAHRIEATPIDMARASYFSFPTRADVREFRKRGHRLL